MSDRGFSLLEVLFATAILVVALAPLAQVFVVSARANDEAAATTIATLLAEEKMEQLRSLTFSFDPDLLPVTDTATDTAAIPELPTGGTGLSPSLAGTLDADTAGYVDYIDALGAVSSTPTPQAVYVRRWSIAALATDPNDIIIVQVLVRRRSDGAGATRLPHQVRLVSAKRRNGR